MKKLAWVLCVILACMTVCIVCGANNEENDDEEATSWYIWGYSCRHELFSDAAPGRPENISPRLWYMGHKEQSERYKVEIVFSDFVYITNEAGQEISDEYAKLQGYESWDELYEATKPEITGKDEASVYRAQRALQWHIEHNQMLVDQYMDPDVEYEWYVLPLTCNIVCELTWDYILALAEEGAGKVYIEYDRNALTGGIIVFPEISSPAESSIATSEELTEQPTENVTTPSVPEQTHPREDSTTVTSEEEINNCTGVVGTGSVILLIWITGVLLLRRRESSSKKRC